MPPKVLIIWYIIYLVRNKVCESTCITRRCDQVTSFKNTALLNHNAYDKSTISSVMKSAHNCLKNIPGCVSVEYDSVSNTYKYETINGE